MIGRTRDGDAARRLSDLRHAQTDDPALKNLLAVLASKLELCSHLPVWEWEAEHEGDVSCAAAFRHLAEEERRTCTYVMDCLQKCLERRAAPTGGAQA